MAEIAHNLYVLHTLHFFPFASEYGQIHCIKRVISFFKKSSNLSFIINGIISGTMNKGILTVVVVVAAVVEGLFRVVLSSFYSSSGYITFSRSTKKVIIIEITCPCEENMSQ